MMFDKRIRKGIVRGKIDSFSRDAHIFTGLQQTIAGRSTVQLFHLEGGGVPSPVGTGVLFNTGEKLFILTAAHVADEFNGRAAFIAHGERLLQLIGQMHASSLPESGRRVDDTYDFAAIRIDGPEVEQLKPNAATPQDVYVPRLDTIHLKGTVIVGFAARDFKIIGKRMFQCQRSSIEAYGVPLEAYGNLGINPDEHIVLKWFNTIYSTGGLSRSPSMRGMSGSGVWLVPALMVEPFPAAAPFVRPKLMGIFTEQRKRNSVVLATKVNFHLRKIMEKYPGLLYPRFVVHR